MGTVLDLIEAKGRRGALEAGIERAVVEAAATYLSDEDAGLGFAYSGWAQCALPHKRLADDSPWGIVSERVKLMVEPGRRQIVAPDGFQSFEFVGVPFGSHARLILLYLQTEALRTGSREIELGNSMRGWLARVGIPAGGMTGKSVRDQAERISRCKLTFDISTGGRNSGLVQQTIVDKALFIEADDRAVQGRLSLETAKLSEGFFEQLKKHPVPLEEAAIKALSNNAPALDVYLWLADRSVLPARLQPGAPSGRGDQWRSQAQAVPRKPPARSRSEPQRNVISHMRRLSKSPKRIRSLFRHPTFRYAACPTVHQAGSVIALGDPVGLPVEGGLTVAFAETVIPGSKQRPRW